MTFNECWLWPPTLKGSIVDIQVNFFQAELMVQIFSKSPVRAIGKVLLIKFN